MTAGDDALAELLERPMADTPVSELRQLFVRGEKPREAWMIGAEIELLPMYAATAQPVEHARVGRLFEDVAGLLGLEVDHEASGAVVGAHGEGHLLSLEPGGQMEIATRPYTRAADLNVAIRRLTAAMATIGHRQGVRFLAMGHQPFVDRDTVPKMNKARYTLMREYLPTRGSRGLDMMHLTGSIQCAVDFSDEANMVEKVQVAARCSPFLTALVSSSPFFRGQPSGFKSMRYEIWRDVDNARSGLWPEMVDAEGMTYARYIARALQVPAMFFMRDDRFQQPEARPYAAYVKDGFQGTTVTVADFVDHLTSLFPEIRLKNYIELRGADCVPPADAMGIAAFWRSILDTPGARADARARLAGLDHAGLVSMSAAVARDGLAAMSPIGPVREVTRDLVQIALRHLSAQSPDCGLCLASLVERAERGASPADDMLALAAKDGVRAALEPFMLEPGER